MESYEEILQRMEDRYEMESGCKVEDVSEVGLRLRTLAGELYRLGTSMDWLELQAFPQTATGAQLDLHGVQRGVTRYGAEKAVGVVSFSRYLPLSFDLVVPKGTVCATSGEPVVEYQTTQEAVLASGQLTVDVPVEAVVAGSAGNAAAGYVTTLVNAPTGINYASNENPITGGRDPESDEDYRKRVLDAWSHCPNGTNADYYRQIALDTEGITSVQVVPQSSGAGTIALYLWGEEVAPSSELLSAVEAKLESRKELGVTVKVQAARMVPVNIGIQVQLPEEVDFTWAQQQISQNVEAFFKSLQVGQGFFKTDLTRVVLNTVAAEQVEYSSVTRDVQGITGVVLRVNTVTVEALS